MSTNRSIWHCKFVVMKVEIIKRVEVSEFIDVELPYYYKFSMDLDFESENYETVNTIYGKIEETKATTIDESSRYNGDSKFTIEVENYYSIKLSGNSCYFAEEYKSTKEEYEAAKLRAMEFINAI